MDSFTIAVFVILAVAGVAIRIFKSPKISSAWTEAARELHFVYEPSFLGTGVISGAAGKLPIKVSVVSKGEDGDATRIEVGDAHSIDSRLSFGRTGWRGLFGGEDLRVGDPSFDAAVHVLGPEFMVLALLSHSTRGWLEYFVQSGGWVADGQLRLEKNGILQERAEIVENVRSVLDLARLLVPPAGGFQRAMAENAIADPVLGVRLRNMRYLVERSPENEETRRAAEAVLNDPQPEMRHLAATAIGGERGFEVLSRIVTDRDASGDLRVAVLEQLTRGFPYPRLSPTVARALKANDKRVRRAAVEAVRAGHDVAMLESVCALADGAEADLAEAVARTLLELGDARAEPTLISLLAHDSVEARTAAAAALRRVGTVRAVEPLLPLTKGLTTAGALKDAARAAVRAIQGRLGEVEAGRVSLAEEDERAGALSVAGAGGEVSLAPPEDVAAEPNSGRERAPGAEKGRG